jgi:hypothetical protein
MKDFFISYNKADAEMAIWINWQLKSVGYTTIIQAEDFGPGDNFVLAMQKAATEAARTIAVLSPDYLQAKFTAPEWAAAFAQDPMGERRLLIPVRVRPVELTGLLKAIVYIDLVDKDEEEAKVSLLSNIQRIAGTPQPVFTKTVTASASPNKLPHQASNHAEHQVGQINRTLQRNHFATHISHNRDRKTHGFLISGESQECPEDARYKLSYLLQEDLISHFPHTPEIKRLHTEKSIVDGKQPEQYLWELLARILLCNAEKSAIQVRLSQLDKCYIFFRELPSDESENQKFLVDMLAAWSSLALTSNSSSHFLLLIHATESSKKSMLGWLPVTKGAGRWRNQMESLLKQSNFLETLLPELHSPSKLEIHDWIKLHLVESAVRDSIKDLLNTKFSKDVSIPLGEFKKTVLPIIKNHHSQ